MNELRYNQECLSKFEWKLFTTNFKWASTSSAQSINIFIFFLTLLHLLKYIKYKVHKTFSMHKKFLLYIKQFFSYDLKT